MSRSDQQRLHDIEASIATCQRYALQLDNAEVADMAFDAILRHLAVIGEGVRALSTETKASMPGIPWSAIAGLRNVVIHEYFRVDRPLVLDIVDGQLDALGKAITGSNAGT